MMPSDAIIVMNTKTSSRASAKSCGRLENSNPVDLLFRSPGTLTRGAGPATL